MSKRSIAVIVILVFHIISLFAADIIVSAYSSLPIKGLYISPKSFVVPLSSENLIRLLNKDGTIRSVYETSAEPNAVVFSEDESVIACANVNGSVDIFNLTNPIANFKLTESKESITSIDMKDQKIIFTSYDKKVFFYNISKRKKQFEFPIGSIPVCSKFISKELAIVGDFNGNAYMFSENGIKYTNKIFSSAIRNIFVYQDRLIFVGSEGKVVVTDLSMNIKSVLPLENNIQSAILSPDSNYLGILYNNNSFKVYSIEGILGSTLKVILNITALPFRCAALAWTNSWREILLTEGSDMYRITFPSGILEKTVENMVSLPKKLFWKDNYLVFADKISNFGIIDIESGKLISFFNTQAAGINDFIVIDDKYIVTVGTDGIARSYDLNTGKKAKEIFLSDSQLTSVDISPDKKFIVFGGWDNKVYVYNYPSFTKYRVVSDLHDNWINDIAINRNGSYIAVSSYDRKVSISKFPDFESSSRKFFSFKYNIWSVSWAHAKEFLATGGYDGILEIWDALYQMSIKPGISTPSIRDIEWNIDDTKIVTACEDGNIYLWNAKSGELISTVNVSSGPVLDIYWNKGSKYIACIADKNVLKILDIEEKKCIATIMIFKDGKYVSFKENGEYMTNIPSQSESIYFSRYNPLMLIDTLMLKKVDNLNLREVEPPVIACPDNFILSPQNNTINIEISDNRMLKQVKIGTRLYDVNQKDFSVDFKIDIEKLIADEIQILAYDDSGNKSIKTVPLEYQNISLIAIANEVVREESGKYIGVLSKGMTVKLLGIFNESYIIDFMGKKGVIAKYFLIK